MTFGIIANSKLYVSPQGLTSSGETVNGCSDFRYVCIMMGLCFL